MKYAHIDKNGQLLGWYDKGIHTLIPTPNIEVSDEVWQNAIDNRHNKVNIDGTTEAYDFRTEDEKAKQELELKIAEAKAYLASTGWYVERLNDPSSGKAIPQEVLNKRADARAIINESESGL